MKKVITLRAYYPDGEVSEYTTQDKKVSSIENTSGTAGPSYTIHYINGNEIKLRNFGFKLITINERKA